MKKKGEKHFNKIKIIKRKVEKKSFNFIVEKDDLSWIIKEQYFEDIFPNNFLVLMQQSVLYFLVE